jgi:ribosomal protein S18 acetylase RimI-like enzyme
MHSQKWSIRQSTKQDRGLVSTLLHTADKKHQHLDWREPHEILEESPFLLSINQSTLTACMACPPETSPNAWLRIFAVQEQRWLQRAWDSLWPRACDLLTQRQLTSIAALAVPKWLENLVLSANFIETNTVIFYEWRSRKVPHVEEIKGTLRGMRPDDLEAIVDLDTRAFSGLWQNSSVELLEALKQSTIATVFERDEKILGYQISTGSAWGGHLARLAVEPEFQGHGIGSALVSDLLRNMSRRGFHRITLNTQGDNVMSHRLYRKFGFKETGDRYPVYEFTFPKSSTLQEVG